MPKMKTHSSAKKRMKVTGTGKIMHKAAFTGHLKRKKTKKRKLRLAGLHTVSKADRRTARKLLCM